MSDSRPIYSIGAVARMLDLPASTLRTWEERYRVVAPGRSPGGHRLYTRDEIERLRYIADKVAAGMSPGDAHRLMMARMEEGLPLLKTSSGAKVVILLAERDPHAAQLSDYFLRTEGYETIVTMTTEEATAAFEDEPPQLVIIDLLLSGGKGLELCRRLAEQGEARILAVSTLASTEKALEAGADAFLQKPIDPLQLISTVQDVLGASAYLRGTSE